MRSTRFAAVAALVTVTACAPSDDTAATLEADTVATTGTADTGAAVDATFAMAELRDTEGRLVATATLRQEDDGVRIGLDAQGLQPGEHGIHIHAVGQCDPGGESPFSSAGPHLNPDNAQHGLENPQGPHAGDLPNLEVGDDGTAQYDETTDRFTLGPGPRSLFDADGSALVLHAAPDDMTTDPSGSSGARIACGVIERQ